MGWRARPRPSSLNYTSESVHVILVEAMGVGWRANPGLSSLNYTSESVHVILVEAMGVGWPAWIPPSSLLHIRVCLRNPHGGHEGGLVRPTPALLSLGTHITHILPDSPCDLPLACVDCIGATELGRC